MKDGKSPIAVLDDNLCARANVGQQRRNVRGGSLFFGDVWITRLAIR
jgi:hypothetical protein